MKQFFFALAILLSPILVFGEVDLSAVGGLSLPNQSISSPAISVSTSNPKSTFMCYGALGSLKFSGGSIGITTGFLYTQMGGHQTYTISGTTTDVDEKAPYYQIPLTFTYWPDPVIGLGLGLYYGLPAGNVTDTGTNKNGGIVTNVNTSQSFSSANYLAYDLGYVLQLQLNIPISKSWFATAAALYEIGQADVNTNGGSNGITATNNTLLALGGIGCRF